MSDEIKCRKILDHDGLVLQALIHNPEWNFIESIPNGGQFYRKLILHNGDPDTYGDVAPGLKRAPDGTVYDAEHYLFKVLRWSILIGINSQFAAESMELLGESNLYEPWYCQETDLPEEIIDNLETAGIIGPAVYIPQEYLDLEN